MSKQTLILTEQIEEKLTSYLYLFFIFGTHGLSVNIEIATIRWIYYSLASIGLQQLWNMFVKRQPECV